jgi:hypothetical protein
MKYYKTVITIVSSVLALALLTGFDHKVEASEEVAPAPDMAVVETAESAGIADNMKEKLTMSASIKMEMTATVSAIDIETRLLTLTDPEGKSVELIVSEEAYNLDQVSVGDQVTAEYVQHIDIRVVPSGNIETEAGKVSALARTEKGEMPGGVILESETQILSIEDINIEANTFKLKNADGVVTEYIAKNRDNLKKVAVGDTVIVTVTDVMAISVESGAKK